MAKRAAIYLRVSTDAQTTENQERALREVAARSGHEIVAVYRDEGISGSKGRDKRPGFDLAGDWSGGVAFGEISGSFAYTGSLYACTESPSSSCTSSADLTTSSPEEAPRGLEFL
jgi:hypothetical protein